MNLKRAIATSLVILYQFTSSSIALTASADSGIDTSSTIQKGD